MICFFYKPQKSFLENNQYYRSIYSGYPWERGHAGPGAGAQVDQEQHQEVWRQRQQHNSLLRYTILEREVL